MIYNDISPITLNKIEELDKGYSCICDKFSDNDYLELFKYMTKETDENNDVLTYDNFKTIYLSTYKLKQIQGYGKFYNIKDVDIDDVFNEEYLKVKKYLDLQEISRSENKHVNNVLDDEYMIISKKKVFQTLKNIDIDEFLNM